MTHKDARENTGAWIVHHGRKLALDANGAAEFPVIDEAAKAANLLSRLGGTDQVVLDQAEVKAIAVAAGLNPRHELSGLLDVLQGKRLIDQGASGQIEVLGLTTRGALGHAADLFNDGEPSEYERAAIHLGDLVSREPKFRNEVAESVADEYRMPAADVTDVLNRSEQLGFVDVEGDADSRLLFNGNLFRRDSVGKTAKVLASLNSAEQGRATVARELLEKQGCVKYEDIERILQPQLFEKLRAAGLYDVNVVGNESGDHAYVTLPAAFHKFVSPMVDDCFDMAKALVSALTYGMTARPATTGRIMLPEILIGKLIRGGEVGPATAIGKDYRVLETSRVVKLRPDPNRPSLFYMRLLKREVGELALSVLTTGDASSASLNVVPAAPMSSYSGPEAQRTRTRKAQTAPSKKRMHDVLEAVRGGRTFR